MKTLVWNNTQVQKDMIENTQKIVTNLFNDNSPAIQDAQKDFEEECNEGEGEVEIFDNIEEVTKKEVYEKFTDNLIRAMLAKDEKVRFNKKYTSFDRYSPKERRVQKVRRILVSDKEIETLQWYAQNNMLEHTYFGEKFIYLECRLDAQGNPVDILYRDGYQAIRHNMMKKAR